MITGSADWTSQDVIGGYQPVGEGEFSSFLESSFKILTAR